MYGRVLYIVKSDTSVPFSLGYFLSTKKLLQTCGANFSWFHHERNYAVVEFCQPEYRTIGIFPFLLRRLNYLLTGSSHSWKNNLRFNQIT